MQTRDVAVTFATYVPGASPEGLQQHVDVESRRAAQRRLTHSS